jgi:hypothetical protein
MTAAMMARAEMFVPTAMMAMPAPTMAAATAMAALRDGIPSRRQRRGKSNDGNSQPEF